MFRPLGEGEPATFGDALQQGLAPDGSLYFPETIPKFREGFLDDLEVLDRQEVGIEVLSPWLWDELTGEEIRGIVDTASTFETPVVSVGDKKVLELFHGPTQAFKDVAARYLASLMGHYNQVDERESTVLVATSGDTGGAIAHGFGGVDGTRVVVLYPKGKVSAMQQEQLRRTAPNVRTLEVDGVFDDCQDLVKQAMGDEALTEINPTSANSISIGRLIPQITYYADAIRQLRTQGNEDDSHRFVVPTGNLGNLTAGLLGFRMGLPVDEFLAANNANNAVDRYLRTGRYSPLPTVETPSNAMDVGKPNNFPRFLELFGGSVVRARNLVKSTLVTKAQTAGTIISVFEEQGYLLDPHTAVAWHASEEITPFNVDSRDVIVSTASPAKFAEEIERLTGIEVDNTAEIAKLRENPEEYDELPNDYGAFKGYLLGMK